MTNRESAGPRKGIIQAVTDSGLLYQSTQDIGTADLTAGVWIRKRKRFGARSIPLVAGSGYLSQRQLGAALNALSEPVSGLTGLPGTGKTFVMRAVAESMAKAGLNFRAVSFCGSAASRLGASIGCDASTIHRLLGFNGFEFEYNENNKLEGIDAVFIDESGQLCSHLNGRLLSALRDDCRVIYIGDPNQLLSIEPGNVLLDVMKCVSTSELLEIRRTNPNGPIGMACAAILRGEVPQPAESKGNGFYLQPCSDDRLVPTAFKAHDRMSVLHNVGFHEIRMIAPSNFLVNDYNRHCEENYSGIIPMIARKNNYDENYFNGDVGILAANGVLINGRLVKYSSDVFKRGFSSTTFVAQGHEFVCSGYMIANKGCGRPKFEDVYTAVTRGRDRFIVIGCMSAFIKGIKRKHRRERTSLLAEFIKNTATILQPKSVQR